MNILFLDDSIERIKKFKSYTPSATVVETAKECIAALTKEWDYVFLDHDLGGQEMVSIEEDNTGSEVVRWIAKNKPRINLIVVHSLNFGAAHNMVVALLNMGYAAIAVPFLNLKEFCEKLYTVKEQDTPTNSRLNTPTNSRLKELADISPPPAEWLEGEEEDLF
jgi:hypothetical protein